VTLKSKCKVIAVSPTASHKLSETLLAKPHDISIASVFFYISLIHKRRSACVLSRVYIYAY